MNPRPLVDGTVAALIREQATLCPEALALQAPGRAPLTYINLERQLDRVAARLRAAGVTPGTRVAVVLPNGPEMASAFLGVVSCAACAPLNPAYQAGEFRFYLEDLGARVLLVEQGRGGAAVEVARELGITVIEIVADAAQPAGCFEFAAACASTGQDADGPTPQDTALILHTSGTTARPKIVPLSQANLVASARNIAAHLALTGADRCLNVMPLFHIHGLVAALLATMSSGGSLVCSPGFDEAAFFDWVADFEPSWYSAVPTMHQAVVAAGARYRERAPRHRFRFVRSSSAALSPKTFDDLQALSGAPVIEAYGMTEAAHQMASNPLPPGVRKPGSVGLPAGVDIGLMDAAGALLPAGATGEIVIRGPGVTAGYENNPEANAKAFANGWLRTGDQGRFDSDGYLVITGRLKEIVNRGGEKISPREVDEALLEHPDVAQATAFAVPHPSLGEDLAAAVVLRPGAVGDEAALRRHLFERLAEFKVPSNIVFVDAIPKGPTGKVQRTSLHDKLGDRLGHGFVAPRPGVEQTLEGIFREVLGSGPVGVHDNFFALGGDSLKGARVVARLNAAFGLACEPTLLFRQPTIALLALELQALRSDDTALGAEIEAMSDEEVARALAAAEAADLTGERPAPSLPDRTIPNPRT